MTRAEPRLRGVFFDLDDTLIATTQAVTRALARITPLVQSRTVGVTTEVLYATMAGAYQRLFGYGTPGYAELATLPTEPLRRRLTQETLARLGIDDLDFTELVWQTYAQAERAVLRPFADTVATLAALKPQLYLGIITNGPARLQREKLSDLGLLSWFDLVLTDAEVGHPKPDSRIFERAEQLAGYSTGELLFVGDTWEADIEGANQRGWHSVYLGTHLSPERTYCVPTRWEILHLPPVAGVLALASNDNVTDTV